MKFGDIYQDRQDNSEVVMALGIDNPEDKDPDAWPAVVVLVSAGWDGVGDITDRPLMDAVEWKLIE